MHIFSSKDFGLEFQMFSNFKALIAPHVRSLNDICEPKCLIIFEFIYYFNFLTFFTKRSLEYRLKYHQFCFYLRLFLFFLVSFDCVGGSFQVFTTRQLDGFQDFIMEVSFLGHLISTFNSLFQFFFLFVLIISYFKETLSQFNISLQSDDQIDSLIRYN